MTPMRVAWQDIWNIRLGFVLRQRTAPLE